jgi:hypothetical protein
MNFIENKFRSVSHLNSLNDLLSTTMCEWMLVLFKQNSTPHTRSTSTTCLKNVRRVECARSLFLGNCRTKEIYIHFV